MDFLKGIFLICRSIHKPLPVLVWNTIKSAGITGRTRGRQGGTAITRIHQIPIFFPILYLVHTSPLGAILHRHGVGFHMYLSMKSTKMDDVVSAHTGVEVCLPELNQWMLWNNLQLNNNKTELLVLHAKHRPKPLFDSITVGDAIVEPTSSAQNIEWSMQDCFLSHHSSRIRPCLSIDSTKTLVHVLVMSRWDHCNSLLYGLPDYLTQRLQYVMNAAAKVITCKQKLDHVTSLLIELHWLPVRQRIIF